MLNKTPIFATRFFHRDLDLRLEEIVEVVRLPFFFILTFTILHYRNAKTLFLVFRLKNFAGG